MERQTSLCFNFYIWPSGRPTYIYNNFSLHKCSKSKTFYPLGEIQPIDLTTENENILALDLSINKAQSLKPMALSTTFIPCFSFVTRALCETETLRFFSVSSSLSSEFPLSNPRLAIS